MCLIRLVLYHIYYHLKIGSELEVKTLPINLDKVKQRKISTYNISHIVSSFCNYNKSNSRNQVLEVLKLGHISSLV